MIRDLGLLYSWRLHAVRRAFARANWAQIAIAGMFIFIGVSLVASAFIFFRRSFTFLLAEPLVGPVLVRYILELSFGAVLLLGVASFVISSIPIIFRSEESVLLTALPVDPAAVYSYRFTIATLVSSWPILIVAMPALAALGVAIGAGFAYYAVSTAVIVLFLAILSLIGGILSFIVAFLSRKLPVLLLQFLEVVAFTAIATVAARVFASRRVFMSLQAQTMADAEAAAAGLRNVFGWMPSHYAVETITSVLPLPGPEIAVESLVFAGVSVLLLAVVAYVLMHAAYIPLRQQYREGGFTAGSADAQSLAGLASRPFPRLFRWRHGYLFEKDGITLFRNSDDLTRAGFLIMLLTLYVLALRGIASLEVFERTDLFAGAITYAYVATGYFALMLGMRFAFPSLSLEGKSAWVLWTSPVHAHEYYSWKFFFWSSMTSLILVAVGIAVAVVFALPLSIGLFLLFAVLCTSISITAITLGQGSIFPDFHNNDPDSLTTSPAGLTATAVGIGYLWVIGRYVHRYALSALRGVQPDAIEWFGVLIVSMVVVGTYWFLARRMMDRLEIV